MRKNFGNKPWCYPQPVFIVGTYDEDGKPNAMNAAWGGIDYDDQINLCLSADHKTTLNLQKTKAFTVSMGTAPQMVARAFSHFADHFESFSFGDVRLTTSGVKRLNAIMQTCGFYNEAGEYSYCVGLPGKGGVGGGIAAICPSHYSVAVWSPRLNDKGNSVVGMKALELLTTKTAISIF